MEFSKNGVDEVASDLANLEAENIYLEETLRGPMTEFKRLEGLVITTLVTFGDHLGAQGGHGHSESQEYYKGQS